jgi:outer membrane protein assembly factor BamB
LGSQDNVLAIQTGRLLSFDLANRAIGWELQRNFAGQPTVADGIIYAQDSGALTAWDEVTHQLLWSWEVPGGGNLQDTMIATDNLLFATSRDTTFAIDLATHKPVWSYPRAGHLALADGALIIAGDDGMLTAISVPEPSTIALALFAACGFLVAVQRRRNALAS